MINPGRHSPFSSYLYPRAKRARIKDEETFFRLPNKGKGNPTQIPLSYEDSATPKIRKARTVSVPGFDLMDGDADSTRNNNNLYSPE